MKGFSLLYLLFPVACLALAPEEKDDFRSQLTLRLAEERLALSTAREDLEPGEKMAMLRDLSAQLTQAKIERNGYLEERAAARRLASAPGTEELLAAFP